MITRLFHSLKFESTIIHFRTPEGFTLKAQLRIITTNPQYLSSFILKLPPVLYFLEFQANFFNPPNQIHGFLSGLGTQDRQLVLYFGRHHRINRP